MTGGLNHIWACMKGENTRIVEQGKLFLFEIVLGVRFDHVRIRERLGLILRCIFEIDASKVLNVRVKRRNMKLKELKYFGLNYNLAISSLPQERTS
jgi:hypothetical protein